MIIVFGVIGACNKNTDAEATDDAEAYGEVVARIGEQKITAEQLENDLASLAGGERRAKQVGAYQARLNRMIDLMVIEQEARDQGIVNDTEYAHELKLIKARAVREERELMQKMLYRKINQQIDISEIELQNYYRQSKNRFFSSRLQLRRIVVDDEKTATEVIVRIAAGEDFGKIAAEVSTDPQLREARGDMGPLLRNAIPRTLRTVAFNLKTEGEISSPFLVQNHWNFLQLTKKEDKVMLPFENVKQQLTQELRRKKAAEAMKTLLVERRAMLNIDINKIVLAKLGPLLHEKRQAVEINLQRDNPESAIKSGH